MMKILPTSFLCEAFCGGDGGTGHCRDSQCYGRRIRLRPSAKIASRLIIFVGHAMNSFDFRARMSVLVHRSKLNVLEFSGHANVTWSGSNYNPIKE